MPTRFGGRMFSVLHSCREVMPGLCKISDSTEKSTGRRSYCAMRFKKWEMMTRDARRVL